MTHTSALDDRSNVRSGRDARQVTDAGRVLNSVRDFALITLDPHGNIVSWNLGAEQIYGWGADEVLGLHFSLLYPSDALSRSRSVQDLRVAQKLGHCADQARCTTKDGVHLLCRVTIDVVEDGSGNICNFVLTSRDVSSFMAAEAALKTQEERYRALIEASAAMVWRASPDGSIIDGASGWGSPDSQVLSDLKDYGWLENVHPDDHERATSTWLEIFASEEPGTSEYRIRQSSGEYRWVLTRAVPLRDPDGVVQEWVGTVADVHEQKSAAERLRQSEEQYRALIEASAAIVWRATTDGSITKVWGWEAFSGQTKGEYTGYGFLEAVHPDDRDKLFTQWQAVRTSDEPRIFEYRVRCSDGKYRWVLTRAVPLLNEDGAVVEWVGRSPTFTTSDWRK
jgi:PAS domain S-box-containing protein